MGVVNLTYKYVKETENEFAHTKVYNDGEMLGYLMKYENSNSPKNANWYFVTKSILPNFYLQTKKQIIERIEFILE